MCKKKCVVLLGLLAVLGMLLGACAQPAAPEDTPVPTKKPPEPAGGGLICVIVPGVENPFFGSEQKIAAARPKSSGTRL